MRSSDGRRLALALCYTFYLPLLGLYNLLKLVCVHFWQLCKKK